MTREQAMDKRYLNPEEPLHIVGQNWQLQWYESEIKKVIRLWKAGYSFVTIASRLNSTPLAVFLLLIDLAERRLIDKRPGYVWGKNEQVS
jgi:hypothetical protein